MKMAFKKIISRGRDGYRVKVWHKDNPERWVRFIQLSDLQEARAKAKSATQMLMEGSSTDDAGATIRNLIELGLTRPDQRDLQSLIGRATKVHKAYTEHGGVAQRHNLLNTAIARGGRVLVLLKDGRGRKVYTCHMAPSDLAKDLHYIGGVLYWRDEKKEPIGYQVINGILELYYIIGEEYVEKL